MLEDNIFRELVERMPVRDTRSNRNAKSNHLFSNFIWMQDGASPHAMESTIQLIQSYFSRMIAKRAPIETNLEWPPNSPDLTPLDYWLWGHVKPKCKKSSTVNEIKEEFTRKINRIPLRTVQRTIKEFPERLKLCLQNNGGHFESNIHRGRRNQNSQ